MVQLKKCCKCNEFTYSQAEENPLCLSCFSKLINAHDKFNELKKDFNLFQFMGFREINKKDYSTEQFTDIIEYKRDGKWRIFVK